MLYYHVPVRGRWRRFIGALPGGGADVGLEGPGVRLTRRQALTGLGGLSAAALLAAGCAARDPAGHALTTATTRRAVHPPGTLLWHVRAPGGIVSLVAAGSVVCAGIDDSSVGVFGTYAMHAGTGQKAWTQYGDTPVTPYAAERGVLFGDAFAGVEALNAASGKVLWTAPAGTVNPGLASTWVLVTGGTVCTTSDIGTIPATRNVVLGLDSGSGRRKWVADFPSVLMGLTSAAGLVFAGSPVPPFKASGKVAALDAASGQRRWTSADLHLVPGDIAATENIVAVSTSLQSENPGSYRTLGLDRATGHELWRADGAADPLIAGGGLLYGITQTLWARDPRTGRQVWEHAFGQQSPAILAVTQDMVLAASGAKVQALSAAAGDELWSHPMPPYPVAVATADDVVYVAAGSEVYAFQA
jgi:outer membrane protein assembly factor BamB